MNELQREQHEMYRLRRNRNLYVYRSDNGFLADVVGMAKAARRG